MRLNTQSTGQRRGRATNSTQASFALTAKRWAVTLTAGVLTITDGTNIHPITLMDRFRGVQLGFGGAGSNNQTANYRVWAVRLGLPANNPFPAADWSLATDADVIPYITDTSTITLGNIAGASSLLYTGSEFVADTITATLATTATTPKGIGSSLESAYALGTMTAYSPGNDTPAKVIIPHMPGHGFIVEFDMTGATSMNYDFELTL